MFTQQNASLDQQMSYDPIRGCVCVLGSLCYCCYCFFVFGAMDCSNPYVLRATVVRHQRGHSNMTTNKTLRHRPGITVEVVHCATKETHTHLPIYIEPIYYTIYYIYMGRCVCVSFVYIYTPPLYTHTRARAHARAHAHTHPVTLAEYGYKTGIREIFLFL